MAKTAVRKFTSELQRFSADRRGQITIVFAFSLLAIAAAVGGGIDLSRSYLAFQQLSHAATLTCQYASRPSIVQTTSATYSGSGGSTTYSTKVNQFLTKTLQQQAFAYTQTNSNPFTYTTGGTADVRLTASIPTTFMQAVGITTVPVVSTAHCFDSPADITPHVTDPTDQYVIHEGFEYAPAGTTGTLYQPPVGTVRRTTPLNTFPTAANYTGSYGTQWHMMGYCLETNKIGQIRSSVPEGSRTSELDCENGSNSAGNSSISTKVYLAAGNYELRYNYARRIVYPEYVYSELCGSAASDISWATSTEISGTAPNGPGEKSNHINVYLDLNTASNAPPLHTTQYNSQSLAGSQLIDSCIYAEDWIERSVRIVITTAGYYWLSFAADGLNDSFGGQIDDIRLCEETCPDTLQDNFPPLWLTTNSVLFQDTFDSPGYSPNHAGVLSSSGNMNNSLGTSGAATSGWPDQTTRGWATAPYNQMDVLIGSLAAQGTQALELDGSGSSPLNRLMSRSFLLDPGYYRVNYRYVADTLFSSLSGVYCGATPSAANVSLLSGSAANTSRVDNGTGTRNKDTNLLGVFMAHAQRISQPVTGGALNSQTSYLNPNGTTSTTPTNDPDALSLTNYNASQNNPLIDICGYASSWQTRTAYVKITKTNYYLLVFSAIGTSDGSGPAIDDVKLTALGSLYMASPPTGAVTIPVPDPQPNAQVSGTGYYIISNPLTPPAALQ